MEYFTLKNNLNMEVTVTDIGAGIYNIVVPDKNGRIEPVLAHPRGYLEYAYATSYFGKPCGRTAGRISNHKFSLDGKEYEISVNKEDIHALHGGLDNISYKCYKARKFEDEKSYSIEFSYVSKDMESGYPGNLTIKITYTLMKNLNVLNIHHECSTDKKTLCNLTNHAYFNLSGNVKRSILGHELMINASKYGYVDDNTLPSSIEDVPLEYDFRTSHKIGDYIYSEPVLRNTNGYDNPFVLDNLDFEKPKAILIDYESGRRLTIKSTYETLVCYTCNYPEGITLLNGNRLKKYDAVCLEMQHFPNSINSDFIKDKLDVLDVDQKYDNTISFIFDIVTK